MRALPLLPRSLQRRQAAFCAVRLRSKVPHAAAAPRSVHRSIGQGDAEMKISRLVLSGAAIGTIAGTGRADLNRSHVFNPGWPPHARFHSVAGWGSIAGSQLLALWLLWRPGQHADEGEETKVKW